MQVFGFRVLIGTQIRGRAYFPKRKHLSQDWASNLTVCRRACGMAASEYVS